MQETVMSHQWNVFYVVLSICIAAVTSFFALELARRFRQSTVAGVALGALLGYGIWAMHFVGMQAFVLPASVSYALPLTLISGACAVGFLIAASIYMFRGQPTVPRILGSGSVAGLGICLMHYLGMAAMQVNALASYRPLPFALSVLIAVGAASVAFYLFSRVVASDVSRVTRVGLQAAASLVMGLAIAGMHYTGMAAIKLVPIPMSMTMMNGGSDPQAVVYLVVGVTMVVFVATYTFILADQLSTKVPDTTLN